jgi:hypothetical protein
MRSRFVVGQKQTNGDLPTNSNGLHPQLTPTQWLLEASRRIPTLKYAIGVVGLVAAAALSIGFFFGSWKYALFGGIALFVGMVVMRLYAAATPKTVRIDPSLPVQVIIWACVIAFIVCLAMGVITLGLTLFASSQHGGNQDTGSKKDGVEVKAQSKDSDLQLAAVTTKIERPERPSEDYAVIDVIVKNKGDSVAILTKAIIHVDKVWQFEPFGHLSGGFVPVSMKYKVAFSVDGPQTKEQDIAACQWLCPTASTSYRNYPMPAGCHRG